MASRFSVAIQTWWQRPWPRKIYDILLYGFALTGVAIIGAWAIFKLGLTNNRGAIDKNYRYLLSVEEMEASTHQQLDEQELIAKWNEQYAKLTALSRFYPTNAMLIARAAHECNNPLLIDQMIAAAETYIDNSYDYRTLVQRISDQNQAYSQQNNGNVIPWMNTKEWEALKPALLRDKALICEAGHLTGVEPRMIVACLVGEQIRLFNTKREKVKQYLGPMKILSVQSQFSYGVNGIKEHTAKMVEQNLKDPTSDFYMGQPFEHLLDFESSDTVTERYNRLVDYRNHLYSYIYTGCILHQTMLQWRRAGYDISHRPDILFTLFNVGFAVSVPKPDPVCGGSHIEVNGSIYTFGAIGFDFYYSGELIEAFPFERQRFTDSPYQQLTQEMIDSIQSNVSSCRRPERGSEYRTDSSSTQNDGLLLPPVPPITSSTPSRAATLPNSLPTPPAPKNEISSIPQQ